MEKISLQQLDRCEITISRSWINTIQRFIEQHDISMNIKSITTSRTVAIEMAYLQNIFAVVPVGEGDKVKEGMTVREIEGTEIVVQHGFIVNKERKLSKTAQIFLKQFEFR